MVVLFLFIYFLLNFISYLIAVKDGKVIHVLFHFVLFWGLERRRGVRKGPCTNKHCGGGESKTSWGLFKNL